MLDIIIVKRVSKVNVRSSYLLQYRNCPIKENKADTKVNFTGLFWMDRNTVFCYVSLMSMVEKSKLFTEYLLKKSFKKKKRKKTSCKEKYFLTLFFLSYIQH